MEETLVPVSKKAEVVKLYNFFKAKFSIDFERLSDQPGNYRETMRVNDDSLKRLKWEPKDRLKKYIFDLEINN